MVELGSSACLRCAFRALRVSKHIEHPISQLALFVAEFIQGIGHAMDLKWVVEGKAETGTVCTVQGWLHLSRWLAENYNLVSISGLTRQLGDTYAALATMVSSEFVVI